MTEANPLEKLDALLEHQEKLACHEQWDSLLESGGQAEELLKQITRDQLCQDPAHCRKISERYNRLRLILAEHRDSNKKQLAEVGQGRRLLRAYGEAK